jgi:hypothetical protein
VQAAVLDSLADGITLKSLGAWRFQGLRDQEDLFQVEAADLLTDVPPLRSERVGDSAPPDPEPAVRFVVVPTPCCWHPIQSPARRCRFRGAQASFVFEFGKTRNLRWSRRCTTAKTLHLVPVDWFDMRPSRSEPSREGAPKQGLRRKLRRDEGPDLFAPSQPIRRVRREGCPGGT